MRQHGFHGVGRGERRPPAHGRHLLGSRDGAAQSVVDREAQGFGEVKDGIIGERIGAIELPPGQQQPARRARIAAGGAEGQRIPEQKFVFAAAGHAGAGGGGLEGEAAAPDAGPWCGDVDTGTQGRQRGTGREGGLDRGLGPGPAGRGVVARPARKRGLDRLRPRCLKLLLLNRTNYAAA